MSTTVNLNGTSYAIPAVGEGSWGTTVSNYLVALSTGALTKAGGSFTLTADTDFGANFGLKSIYYKSRATASTSGVVRLGNAEYIGWRNAANSADKLLRVNSSDLLEFAGNPVVSVTTAATTKGDIYGATGANTLTRLGVGTNGQVLTADSTQTTGLSWTSPLVNPMDAIGQIIYGGSAGAVTKLAAGTANTILQSNGSAAPTWVSTIDKSVTIDGITSGSSVASGKVGEVLSTTAQGGGISVGTSATNIASLAITAGLWLVSVSVNVLETSSASNDGSYALGTTTASYTGTTLGYDQFNIYTLASNGRMAGNFTKMINISGTTTYYLNCISRQGAAASGTWLGSIIATRIK